MADYIRREEAVKVLTSIALEVPESKRRAVAKCINQIELLPAADVAPAVPCKGCEHAERYERTDGTAGYYCGHPQSTFVYGERWDRVFKPVKNPDDFCSFGERRTENGK